jgi:glucokinase
VLAIGVDLGGTNLRIAVGDEEGRLLRRVQEPTERRYGPTGIAAQIIRLITSLRLDFAEVQGIGIGSLGPLDVKRGVIVVAPNLPFDNIPLTAPLSRAFPVPVRVLNDCSAAVLGEQQYGAGRGVDNLAYITLSSGIGCGAIVDGRLLLGKDGNAGEMGHVVVDQAGRLRCGCGKRGHWEAYCSGNNIPSYVRLWIREHAAEAAFAASQLAATVGGDLDAIDARQVFAAARAGDALSRAIIEDLGRLNAIGVANVLSAYDPALVTLGGSVTLCNPALILDPIARRVAEYAVNRVPRIRVTPLGHDVVLYGALAMPFLEL